MEDGPDGWDELRRMRRQMNRMLSGFGNLFSDKRLHLDKELDKNYRNAWAEFSESSDEYLVSIELPGITKDDIHLEVTEDRMLDVRAEKKRTKEHEDDGRGRYGVAKTYFGFRRIIQLPEDASGENLHASYKNGVLEIRLKKDKNKSRKVIKID